MKLEPRDDWVYWTLLAHYATAETRKRFWAERPDDLPAFMRRQPEWAELEPKLVQEAMVLHNLSEQGGSLITLADAEYPEPLRTAENLRPPMVLYALGDVRLLAEHPFAAFAGSRNASERAIQEAQRLASELVSEGYHTVTGFAKGVDATVAHTTLEQGGRTIGVLAQGLLHRLTQQAAREFMHALNEDRLLLLSELHPNAPWSGSFAMMRNRLVAALGDFLIVVESGPELSQRNGKTVRSGTYECAKIARKIGRPVYALDLPAEGNQQLLAQGIATRWGEPFEPPTPAQGALFD
ncbi:MAG: DNA-protecting protein DprA [Fimbriimonadales bacterium]|nr:DNA-protecting protein DprA [Fimbriimonadales bacterium]